MPHTLASTKQIANIPLIQILPIKTPSNTIASKLYSITSSIKDSTKAITKMSHMPIFNPNFTRDICDPFNQQLCCPLCFHAQPFPTFHNNFSPFSGPMFHNPTLPMLHHQLAIHDTMALKWQENPEAYVLRVEIPSGIKKEEVEMKVEGNLLKISGKKQVKKEEKREDWHHFEQSKAEFMNAVSLPEKCRADEIKPSFENGIFTVTVPKRDAHRESHFKNIQVKGSNSNYGSH